MERVDNTGAVKIIVMNEGARRLGGGEIER
jgi:hypothetical protein